jgi:hypothetical protein
MSFLHDNVLESLPTMDDMKLENDRRLHLAGTSEQERKETGISRSALDETIRLLNELLVKGFDKKALDIYNDPDSFHVIAKKDDFDVFDTFDLHVVLTGELFIQDEDGRLLRRHDRWDYFGLEESPLNLIIRGFAEKGWDLILNYDNTEDFHNNTSFIVRKLD